MSNSDDNKKDNGNPFPLGGMGSTVWRPKVDANAAASFAELLDSGPDCGGEPVGPLGAFDALIAAALPPSPAEPDMQLEVKTLIANKQSVAYAASRLGLPPADVVAIASGKAVPFETLAAARQAIDLLHLEQKL